MIGFSPKVRRIIKERAGRDDSGYVACERCEQWVYNPPIHHRRPRKGGGDKRPETNLPANGVALCTPCHAWAESERTEAMRLGWLVPDNRNPAEWPLQRRGARCLLGNDGSVQEIPEAA